MERNKLSSADVPKPPESAHTHGEIKIGKKFLNNLIVNVKQLLLETSFLTTLIPHAWENIHGFCPKGLLKQKVSDVRPYFQLALEVPPKRFDMFL